VTHDLEHVHGLFVEEDGSADAPVVAVVHGSMDRAAGMIRIARRLRDRFRVVRYDRRGYGRSVHEGPFGMDAQVDDLVAVLAGRRAVLIGHSYGGNVVLATAGRHPDLVAAAAIYETPLSWAPWWPASTAGSRAVDEPGTTAEAAERFMRRLIGDQRWEELPDRVRRQRCSEGAALVGELSDLRVNPPWHPDDLHLPVVFASGSAGAPHHQRGMADAASIVPGAALVVLDGCGHDAPLWRADQLVAELVEPVLSAAGPPWSRK
jgi:pimeloyl-ACP methyl ester carboxylesterase